MLEKYLTDETFNLDSITMARIKDNLAAIRNNVEEASKRSQYHQKTRILLATKTRTPDEINFAISQGIDLIGENRVQELCEKYEKIQKNNVEIHFIGALQTNKVKYIIDKVSMIHSLDRLSLAKEIDRQARKHGITMDVLCEVNIGYEESKSGVLPEKTEGFIREVSKLPNVHICGLMAIPPILENISTQKQYFQKIMELYIDISTKKIDNVSMSVLSYGMSSDYPLAIECGSTIVRIGTAAFGERNYK